MREVGRTDVDVDYVLNYNYQLGRTYVKSVEEVRMKEIVTMNAKLCNGYHPERQD